MKHLSTIIAIVLVLGCIYPTSSLPVDHLASNRKALMVTQNHTATAASFQSRFIVAEVNWGKLCNPMSPYRQKEVSTGAAWCTKEWVAFLMGQDEKNRFLEAAKHIEKDSFGKPQETADKYRMVKCRDMDWTDDKHDTIPCTDVLKTHYIEPMSLPENVTAKYALFSHSPLIIKFFTNDSSYAGFVSDEAEITRRVKHSNDSVNFNLKRAHSMIANRVLEEVVMLPRMLRAAYKAIPEASRPKNSQGDVWEAVPPEVANTVKKEFLQECQSYLRNASSNAVSTLEGIAKAMSTIMKTKKLNGTHAKQSEKIGNASYKWVAILEDRIGKIDEAELLTEMSYQVTSSLHKTLGLEPATLRSHVSSSPIAVPEEVEMAHKQFQSQIQDIQDGLMDVTARNIV